jgi:23S rRNA (cytidine1920-2'-O)/16S rRNA (cytidine1409-2'-O)-methyltransferase
MAARKRLDKLMVARGLAVDVAAAAELISRGAVTVSGLPATTAAMQLDVNAGINVREADKESAYVSRGGLKLACGLDAFGLNVVGLTALDVGASTGGFTDVLLKRGAARVYAIDVGYGQLAWSLQTDQRVVVMDRMNVRSMTETDIPGGADLAVIDVSFVSLTAVLPSVARLLRTPREGQNKSIVALIKPQFEVERSQIEEGGVVQSEAYRQDAIRKVTTFAKESGFVVRGIVVSPITGPAGNVEYLQHFQLGPESSVVPVKPTE